MTLKNISECFNYSVLRWHEYHKIRYAQVLFNAQSKLTSNPI